MRTLLLVFIVGLLVSVAQVPLPAASIQAFFADLSTFYGVAESSELWGTAVADWNGDGCDDLYVGRHNNIYPRLYRNPCSGRFIDEVSRLRLDLLPWRDTKDRHTPAFADYDGDDRLDLFVTTGAGEGTDTNDDQLFHQMADGNFENLAPAFGMIDSLGSGRHGIWFDYDRDGDLDLALVHREHTERPDENRNILWRNEGGTGFVNVAAAAGIDAVESSVSGLAADLDQDGDQDLIVVPGRRGSFYVNQGGTFLTQDLGFSNIQSVAAGDYDNDGDLDLFLARGRPRRPNAPLSALLRNDGGVWTDVTGTAGVGVGLSLSAVWLDVDNDEDLDLYVTRDLDNTGKNAPNVLFINNGDGTFTDTAPTAGVAGPTDSDNESVTWGDFNRDGELDLVVGANFSSNSVRLYQNGGTPNHWIILRLRDPFARNRQAIGAKVWLTDGGVTQYREVTGGGPYRAQTPSYLHFGLKGFDDADMLRIRWPDGDEDVYTNLDVDRHYLATKRGALSVEP